MSELVLERPPAEPLVAEQPVEYPYSDGKFLIEADPQANAVVAIRYQLQWYFKDRPDSYIAGNLAVYYEKGNPQAVVAPDVFAVLGVPGRDRKSYRVWEEGKPPDFVLEVASPATARRDREEKREVYGEMRVREYWRFDPTGTQFEPRLEAWRLKDRRYERLAGEADASGGVAIRSEALGLEVRAEGQFVRFRDPRTGKDLLTYAELDRAREEAERGREEEKSARLAAERRIADLEAMLAESSDRSAPGASQRKS